MKYLYCPKCKEVRAKTWYQRRNRCLACIGPATEIQVPNSFLTYLNYVLYVVVLAVVGVYVVTDVRNYIWVAVGMLAVAMVSTYVDLVRGEKFARAKVKITNSDLGVFRRKGWT